MTETLTREQVQAEPVEAPALVSVKNLQVSFPEVGVDAVKGISFELHAGKCVALVGESGSGKSVTSRSLIGLAGRGAQVQADELRFEEEDLLEYGEWEFGELRGYGVGYILQDALVSLDPFRRIGDEVGDSVRVHGALNRRERKEHVLKLLSNVGIPNPEVRYRQYAHQLSGGLRQRALIASAISAGPKVLVADEPTTALDVTVQAQIISLLNDLKNDGTALLLVSHDLAVVSTIADEIIVLKDGEVVERGTSDEVLLNPQHPYTQKLLAAVPTQHNKGDRLSDAPASHFAPIRKAVEFDDAETAHIVTVEGLKKHYRVGHDDVIKAVDGVSFGVVKGKTLGIVGESGSGKSSIASVILGFLEPDEGTVSIGSHAWAGKGVAEKVRRPYRPLIQSIHQDPLGSFDPRHNVEAILNEALSVGGVAKRDRRVEAVRLLEQVGLQESHLSRNPLQLSGGQRQRVAIAKALATGPSIIVCDEPVSALDVSVQAQVLDLLSDLQKQTGVTLIFISHDLAVVNHIAHDVIVLKDGVVVEQGESEQIFTKPQHEYTQALLASVPRIQTGFGLGQEQ